MAYPWMTVACPWLLVGMGMDHHAVRLATGDHGILMGDHGIAMIDRCMTMVTRDHGMAMDDHR